MDMASKLDARADYIRQLTQSLSSSGTVGIADSKTAGGSTNQNVSNNEIDDNCDITTGGETVTSVLYKYGKEATQVDKEMLGVRSSGSLSLRKHSNAHKMRSSSASMSMDNGSVDGGLSGELRQDSLARDGSTVSYAEDPHVQFLINKEQNKSSKSVRLVSGSQFRNTTKMNINQCEQCFILDRVSKKYKETIRGLRLQIARLEEQNHDLKRFKNSDANHHVAKIVSSSLSSSLSAEEEEENMEDIEFLANKCENYEIDLTKMKKMLLYERTLNEGLRKTLDETRTGLREELASAQAENTVVRADWLREKDRREALQVSNDDNMATLLRYKQQLERTENKLSDCTL